MPKHHPLAKAAPKHTLQPSPTYKSRRQTTPNNSTTSTQPTPTMAHHHSQHQPRIPDAVTIQHGNNSKPCAKKSAHIHKRVCMNRFCFQPTNPQATTPNQANHPAQCDNPETTASAVNGGLRPTPTTVKPHHTTKTHTRYHISGEASATSTASRSSRTVATRRSPAFTAPSSSNSASWSCRLRWITRRSGRAP